MPASSTDVRRLVRLACNSLGLFMAEVQKEAERALEFVCIFVAQSCEAANIELWPLGTLEDKAQLSPMMSDNGSHSSRMFFLGHFKLLFI